MRRESVSVVIPTFDRVDLLPRAVDSVLGQSRPADEILVVDDGSADGSAEMLARQYAQVRVLEQAHTGVSAARNHGITEAQGEWIAFLDSDDEWLPDKLATQMEHLHSFRGRLCHCDEIWIRDGRRVNPRRYHAKRGGDIYEDCLARCVISPSAVVMHRSLFDDVGMFDETLPACEDYDLWLRVCSRETVEFVDRQLLRKYGGHEDQLSRQIWGLDRFRVRSLDRLLASADLTDARRRSTREVLLRKLDILIDGATKRDRTEHARTYETMRRRHLSP